MEERGVHANQTCEHIDEGQEVIFAGKRFISENVFAIAKVELVNTGEEVTPLTAVDIGVVISTVQGEGNFLYRLGKFNKDNFQALLVVLRNMLKEH